MEKVPIDIPEGTIVFDVGGGEFDHHQPEGNGKRENGTPYASFGLLWKEFGADYCKRIGVDPQFAFAEFDRFVEGIDGYDNGLWHDRDTPTQNVSNCIRLFNPTWEDTSEERIQEAFVKAVNFAEVIFDNVMENITSRFHAREVLSEAVKKCSSDTLFLERFLPYASYPEMKGIINNIVYPSLRGGLNLQIINHDHMFPQRLLGLSGEALQKATGIPTAIFVHNSGRLAGASTKEDISKLISLIEEINTQKAVYLSQKHQEENL